MRASDKNLIKGIRKKMTPKKKIDFRRKEKKRCKHKETILKKLCKEKQLYIF